MRELPEFTGDNKDVMNQYIRHAQLKGKKYNTIYGEAWQLVSFFKFFDNKNANKITKEDIEKFVLYRREKYSPTTLHNNIITLRTFYKWLLPDNDFFNDIKSKPPKNNLPVNELLTQDDVLALVAASGTQRNRAIIMALWDSAARISELLDLNISNVQFDKYGAVVIVAGKTGMRRIRLIDSMPDLQLWLNQHPDRNNHNAPLFVTTKKYDGKYKRLDRHTVSNMLRSVARKAEIKKRVHAHGFRHGRLTDLSKQGFNEMELRIIAGWTKESGMAATYLHLSGGDVDKKILAKRGIIEDETKQAQETLKAIECPRCKTKNPNDAKYCSTCSMVLDAETAIKMDEAEKVADPHITKAIEAQMEKIKQSIIDEMLQKME